MINPTRDGRVLFSGPIVKHVHVIGPQDYVKRVKDAYVTMDVYAHGKEAYIARVYLVVYEEERYSYEKERRYVLATASDVFKYPYEVYRYPEHKVAIARMHKSPEVEADHLHLPHDMIRFASYGNEGKPYRKFDVRFHRINNIVPKENLEVEIHVIKSAFVGRYEKIRLRYDVSKNVVHVKEEEDDVRLIERKIRNTLMYSLRNLFRISGSFSSSS